MNQIIGYRRQTRLRDRQIDVPDRQIGRQTYRLTDLQTYKHTDRVKEIDRQASKQTYRERLTDRQVDRKTHRLTNRHIRQIDRQAC